MNIVAAIVAAIIGVVAIIYLTGIIGILVGVVFFVIAALLLFNGFGSTRGRTAR